MRRHRRMRDRGRPAVGARPRYARISAAALALLVTLVSVLGGLGILPAEQAVARPEGPRDASRPAWTGSAPASDARGGAVRLSDARIDPRSEANLSVPADSGSGRRVVFDMSRQRVWLVGRRDGADVVRRTYLVSGSVTDNLEPGTYSVYSRSARAWGVDDSGTMRYMVRFTRGSRAAIGFHDIPVVDGAPVQTRAQLGSPQSHGCIRQWRPDARALWDFAPVRTRVVVVV